MTKFVKLCDNLKSGDGTVIKSEELVKIKDLMTNERSDCRGNVIKKVCIMKDRSVITETGEEYAAVIAQISAHRREINGKAYIAVNFLKKRAEKDGTVSLSCPDRIIEWEVE